MADAREIIAKAIAGEDWCVGEYRMGMGPLILADHLNGLFRYQADAVLQALSAAGYRILGPGEVKAISSACEEALPYVGAYESEHCSNVALSVITKLEAAIRSLLGKEGETEADRIRRGMEDILREQGERDIPFAPVARPGGRT